MFGNMLNVHYFPTFANTSVLDTVSWNQGITSHVFAFESILSVVSSNVERPTDAPILCRYLDAPLRAE